MGRTGKLERKTRTVATLEEESSENESILSEDEASFSSDNAGSLAEDDLSDMAEDFSDLEEESNASDDNGSSGKSAFESVSDSDGSNASIAYSSDEGEDSSEDLLDITDTISDDLLNTWIENFESKTVTLRTTVSILAVFSKWAFPSSGRSNTNQAGTHQKKKKKITAKNTTIELENPNSEQTFYDLMFGHVARHVTSTLTNASLPAGLRRPLRDFLTGMIAYLEAQQGGNPTDKLIYILKYGMVAFLDILVQGHLGSGHMKPLIKALVKLWCMASSSSGDEDSVNEEMRAMVKVAASKKDKRKTPESDGDIPEESEATLTKKEEEIRLMAFILLKRISIRAHNKNMTSIVLKVSYMTLLRSHLVSRAATRASVIPFLLNSLTELWILDSENMKIILKPENFQQENTFDQFLAMIRARQALAYQVGFPLLRELACTLSKLLHEPNKENKSKIISWKWVLACQIWAKLLSANDHLYFACLKVLKKSQKFNHALVIEEKKDFPLRMLGYPFMNIAMGSFSWAQANPSLVPFQLQILHVLDVLLEAKPAFTKVDSLLTSNDGFPKFSLFVSYGILSILELIHDKTRPSKKLLQLPNEIKHCLSMPDAFLATRLYSDAILVEAMSLLKKDFIRAADHIAFPEAIFLLQAKLKQLAKKTKNAALHKPLLALLKTVQLHTDWMMDWRKNTLKASPFDLASGIIKEINQSDVRKDTAAPETKPNAKKMVPLPMNGLQFVNAAGFSLKKGPLFA